MTIPPINLDFAAHARRAIAECRTLAAMTEEPGGITRTFLTAPVHDVHRHLTARMQSLGMTTHVDSIGNLRGLWQPQHANAKRLLIGSHIDTVPNAGAFDGILGVTLALELVELALANPALAQSAQAHEPLSLEVIAFSEEEGVRYGVPFLGSRVLAGQFDSRLLALEDSNGIRMDAAIRAFGLDPDKIAGAALDPAAKDADLLGFFELHIEQGPVLESEDLQLAVVDGIVGQSRLGFRFTGHANHAGTTPMHLRRDALAAAAEWISAVETAAQIEPGLVATVGKIEAKPNAGNVIPGQVDVSLDLRHLQDETRDNYVHVLTSAAQAFAQKRNVHVEWSETLNQPAVPMDPHLTAHLAAALESAGFPLKRMSSGAGHDAMVMATRLPTSMLFLRSPAGLSHHPDETVREQDVEAALRVGHAFLARLAAAVS
jgi:allantoate deiminase